MYRRICNRQAVRSLFVVPGLLLLLAGCGAAQTPAQQPTSAPPTATSADEAPATPDATTPPAAATATQLPAETPDNAAPAPPTNVPLDVIERARAALAAHRGIEPGQLVLQSGSEQEWADSALGCPAPDQVYMQVITPGYRVTFTSDEQTYAVHTDQTGDRLVWCMDDGTPQVLGGGP